MHRDAVPAIEDACTTLTRVPTDRRLVALYRLLDALVDSMFPFLAALDDRIDDLQDQIFVSPKENSSPRCSRSSASWWTCASWSRRSGTWCPRCSRRVVPIPGMTAETERYVRDLYDHLIRISDMVDSYRDLLSGSLDAYMSMVSNRLNDAMKQLTIIATVFLPLSFLTGFFGQNFGWLVNRMGPWAPSSAFGIGTEVAGRRRPGHRCSSSGAGWVGAERSRPSAERAVRARSAIPRVAEDSAPIASR